MSATASHVEERELHCFASEADWVIAYDEEDAFAVIAETYGPECEKDMRAQCTADEDLWTRLYPTALFKFAEGSTDDTSEKTIAEWIKSEGRGFFASTEW